MEPGAKIERRQVYFIFHGGLVFQARASATSFPELFEKHKHAVNLGIDGITVSNAIGFLGALGQKYVPRGKCLPKQCQAGIFFFAHDFFLSIGFIGVTKQVENAMNYNSV